VTLLQPTIHPEPKAFDANIKEQSWEESMDQVIMVLSPTP
jgi:hypothetical protein